MKTCLIVGDICSCNVDMNKVISDLDNFISKGLTNFFVFCYGDFGRLCFDILMQKKKKFPEINIFKIEHISSQFTITYCDIVIPYEEPSFFPSIETQEYLYNRLFVLSQIVDTTICFLGDGYLDINKYGERVYYFSLRNNIHSILYKNM